MQMPGRSYTGESYRYGFNGMEKDDEIKGSGNSYDFGARMYDPRIARWTAVDPHSNRYPSLSPYCGMANDPGNIIDPDGRDIVIVVDFADKTSPGHTMIGVMQYDKLGNELGTYVFYELHPRHSWPADQEPVPGKVDSGMDWTDSEIREAAVSGFIILDTSFDTDQLVEGFLKEQENLVNTNKRDYDADDYNCTTFACEALIKFVYPEDEGLGEQVLSAEVEVFGVEVTFEADVATPNQLFNDLFEKDNVKTKSSNNKASENGAQEFVNRLQEDRD